MDLEQVVMANAMGPSTICGSVAPLSPLPAASTAVPTTNDHTLGGGLAILAYNDLNNTPVAGSGAILLGQSQNFTSASTACQLLSESLWTFTNDSFFGSLNNSLSNQIYEGIYPSNQLFWVDRTGSDCSTCNAIDSQGSIHQVDCSEELAALCSQSAPVSSSTSDNTSTTFQITHQVARQHLTGYRDFYVWKFLGVRYAPPPERFDYSTVLDDTGSHSALVAGADCLQPIGQVTSGSSDDCLFLNIWTPFLPPSAGTTKEKLKPVAFYIYGGNFQTGSGKDPNTDGTNLASRADSVVVALNYRVGNLGFLAFNDSIHNGNYGIGDMVTALEWVSRNIEYFGGDPDRVTIFGESAGAAGVHILLASPKAEGLFSNAIMQSDPGGLSTYEDYVKYLSIQDSFETFTLPVLNATGCNVSDAVSCLRAFNGTSLANLTSIANAPVEDHYYLVTSELILNNTSGYAGNVAVISGTNRDEGAILVPSYPPEGITVDEWFATLSSINITALLDTGLFPIPSDPDSAAIFNLTSRLLTDALFRCDEQAKVYTAAHHHPFLSLHTYIFNRTYSPLQYTSAQCSAPATSALPNGDTDAEYFKCHGGEQIVVFGNVARTGLPQRDARDLPFQQLILDYWASFIWTRDPNPALEGLAARGYWSTLAQTQAAGPWDTVDPDRLGTRWLQWDGGFMPLFEVDQCAALGLPITMYEAS